MNFEAAEKALQYLEAEPRRFDMGQWLIDSSAADLLEDEPPCGTACCFAGAVVLSHGFKLPKFEIYDKAYELLGLDAKEGREMAERLFYCDRWPEKFILAYRDAITQEQRVAALRAYIESLKPAAEERTRRGGEKGEGA